VDHRYIEQNSVADLYLDHALPQGERAAFEAHLVDCQECTDRVLLAEMFHNRNGITSLPATLAAEAVPQIEPPPPPSSRARFVVSSVYTPRQLFLLLAAAATLLVLIPCIYFFLWALHA
jgi:anti-sigma factor RsiW